MSELEHESKARADSARSGSKERLVSSRELLGEDRLLRIEHKGEIYTLRVTRNERLILTK